MSADRGAAAAQRRRAGLQRGGDDRAGSTPLSRRRSPDSPSSWCSSMTARPTGRPAELAELAGADPRVKVICLSRNFGHQTALTAGLDHASGRRVVMLDADLQDPPELIPDAARPLAGRLRRRLRRARAARGRVALQARHSPLVLQAVRLARIGRAPAATRATSGCSTAGRSTRCCRCASATASCAG